MCNGFDVEVRVMPYFMRDAEVGNKVEAFHVPAEDFEEAVRMANLVLHGIKTNPAVWKAEITSVSATPMGEKRQSVKGV